MYSSASSVPVETRILKLPGVGGVAWPVYKVTLCRLMLSVEVQLKSIVEVVTVESSAGESSVTVGGVVSMKVAVMVLLLFIVMVVGLVTPVRSLFQLTNVYPVSGIA